MLISSDTYIAMVVVLILIICAIPLSAKFIMKKGNKLNFVYLFLLIVLPINWFTPAVYTVTNCGEYTKDVLIFPTTLNNEELNLGWHNYFFNKSSATIVLEDVVYGNVSQSEIAPEVEILPGKSHRAPFVHLDYAFETPPNSASSKSSGVVKHLLSCQ